MKELNFDSGLVTYSLNGKCEVSFNPTDSNFVERLYSAFEDLDKKQEDCVVGSTRSARISSPKSGRFFLAQSPKWFSSSSASRRLSLLSPGFMR